MQYLLRFILASYVVWFHIGSYYFPSAGPFAVFGFYTLSGFIITKVLNEVYYKKENPTRDFFVNRFWRLYPTFIIAVAFGAVLAWLAADSAHYWNPLIRLPEKWDETFDTLSNLTIIGLHHGIPSASSIRFAPPSWSTAIEVYFYIFLFMAGARSWRLVSGWLGLSVATLLAIIGYLTLTVDPIYTPDDLIYQSVFGVSICFAIGAVTYFLQRDIQPTQQQKMIGTLAFALAVIMPLVPWKYLLLSDLYEHLMLYTECVVIAVFLLYRADTTLGRWSVMLGDLSYPLFLTHWQVAITLMATGIPLIKSDAISMMIIYPTTIAVAFAMVRLIEHPLKSVRNKVRSRA